MHLGEKRKTPPKVAYWMSYPLMIDCPTCGNTVTKTWFSAPDRFHQRSPLYTLVYCTSCSLVWTNDPPPPCEMTYHYGADYHRLVNRAGETSPKRWRRHAEILTKFKSGGAVLDVGCSSGSFLAALSGQEWNLYGIEMSSNSAEKAVARTGAKIFVGDVFDAEFEPETFDAITCFDVLEHLYQPRATLQKIWQWLKPDGVIYLFVPNIRCWESRLFGSYWYGLELPRHLYHFSPNSLKALVGSVGFRQEFFQTPPINYVEYSTRYAITDLAGKLGFARLVLPLDSSPHLAWRGVRKLIRITALYAFSKAASLAGSGPAIEAVFRKVI